MLKFWESLIGGVAQKWLDRLVSPALAFWLTGGLLYASRVGWDRLEEVFRTLPDFVSVAVLVLALLVVVGSATLVEGLQEDVLRFLEGYWPGWLGWLRKFLVRRAQRRYKRARARLQMLASRWSELTPEEREEFTRLDHLVHSYPRTLPIQPTRVGNVLRAAEEYPQQRYGLRPHVVWPRMWLVLPDRPRGEVAQARERLNAAVRVIIWSLAFLIWCYLTIPGTPIIRPRPPMTSPWWVMLGHYVRMCWPAGVALFGAWWGYTRVVAAAEAYGELLRAIFDVYRDVLYQALEWPEKEDEWERGRSLSRFLWLGRQ